MGVTKRSSGIADNKRMHRRLYGGVIENSFDWIYNLVIRTLSGKPSPGDPERCQTNLMNIVIRNYLSGSFQLESEPNVWDVIVILDSGISHTDFVARQARRHLYLRFDDVKSDLHGKRTPTNHDIQAALDFAAQSQNLMVCCRAGQSRSAATAFLICHQRLGSNAARCLLNPERHIPNSLVVELGTQVMDNPSIMQTFIEWQADHKHIKLSECLDDIEREFDELELQGARNRIVNLRQRQHNL